MDILPRDTHVIDPKAIKRLSGQSARLLARLERGPATRAELAEIAPNVTARISDLRAYLRPLGRTVKLLEENKATGFTRYGIVDLEKLF